VLVEGLASTLSFGGDGVGMVRMGETDRGTEELNGTLVIWVHHTAIGCIDGTPTMSRAPRDCLPESGI
jgi:hypothetical protein